MFFRWKDVIFSSLGPFLTLIKSCTGFLKSFVCRFIEKLLEHKWWLYSREEKLGFFFTFHRTIFLSMITRWWFQNSCRILIHEYFFCFHMLPAFQKTRIWRARVVYYSFKTASSLQGKQVQRFCYYVSINTMLLLPECFILYGRQPCPL